MNGPCDAATPGAPPDRAGNWGWFVLAALIAVEIATFTTYARREITWSFPGSYDQVSYLLQAYTIGRDATNGLPGAVGAHWKKAHASGVLLPIQAAVHGVVLGRDRLGALSVNFFYLAVFQWAFAATLLWLARNWWAALAGVGLTLPLATTFQPGGGAFDFRMDFAAFCLYGIFVCALVRSRALLGARGAAAVGGVAAVLVLFRFITAAYLAGVFGLLAAAILVRRVTAADPEARRRADRRLRGWAAAVGIAALAVGPVMYRQREAIYSYYVVGHVLSTEKDIRAAEEKHNYPDINSLYYLRSLAAVHTGPTFWWAAAVLCAVGAAGLGWAGASGRTAGRPAPFRGTVVVVALAFAAPFLVLSINAVKSPVVGNVLLPALLWGALVPVLAVPAVWERWPWPLRGAGAAVLVAGLAALFNGAAGPSAHTRVGADGPRTMHLFDDLADACEQKGVASPEVFVDANTHQFQAGVMQVVEYERHGRWRAYRDSGTDIFAGEEEEHFRRATRADVVVLAGKSAGDFRFPYDETLARVRPRLQTYCDANLIKVGEYRIGDRPVATYVRGHLRVEGATTDGWITDAGVRLVGTVGDLKRCGHIELRRAGENYLGRTPGARAEVKVGADPSRPLAVTVVPDLTTVRVTWERVDHPADTPVVVRLHFDCSFVPKERGMGTDPRALVMCLGSNPRTHLILSATDPRP